MDSLFALRLLVPAASTDAEAAQHAWQQLQPTMREAASLGVLLAAAAEVGLLGGGRLLLQLRECEGGGQHIATDPRIDRLLGSRSGAKVAYQLGCTHGLLPLVVMNPPGEEQHLEMDVATAAMLGAGSSMRLRLILSGAAQQLLLSPTVVRNESAARMYLKGSSKLQRQAASATSSTKPAAAVLRLPLPFGSGSGSGAARNAGGAKPAAELLVGLAAAAAQEAAAASGGQLGALQLVERGGEILRCWQAVARATDKAGDQRRGWAAAMMTEEGQDALAALKPWLPPAAMYNRDNRLKVSRDEAKYEEAQSEVRGRAEAAEREARHQLLRDRARRKYGDRHGQALEPPSQQQLEQQPQPQQLEWQQPAAADAWQADTAALRGLAAGRADHFAALEQQAQRQRQKPPRERHREAEPAAGDGAERRAGKKRRRWQEEPAAAGGAPPAEKRDERRRRGDPDTQTSDARFDEQFSFAHKLYGQQALPWYAKRGSTLPSEEGEGGPAAQPQHGSRRQMWRWEMQARAALAGVGGTKQQQQQQQQQPALLAGVMVLQQRGGGGGAGGEGTSSSSSSSGSDSSSSSSSSSGSSSGDSSDERSRRRRGSKHRRRRKDGGGSRRHGKKSKEGKGKGRRRERKESKDKGGKKSVEQLRLERLQREEGERQRQQRVMAVAAGRDPALLGKKYYGGYGFGKR
ncbi:hypothetical protein CHLNCDRAFT_142503 [Chlorella variabilis]|uniref:Uncharacterized protein n=1 Tax=Chlorella variabilis TaxID=554065 RepID=E1ZTS6_CHLVA|nr:hypothetical protein CHLNCDRAFT_142503 [Chlorella variabilis]EFN50782.1 hypothetical protein CHLNCDRAFT_142503 [Chlorella variabilis]|eukprot:XP_005852319.1 hypothetical protein CHLNCDRAFT_142503 [Chlorella variabilis]